MDLCGLIQTNNELIELIGPSYVRCVIATGLGPPLM